MWFKLPHPLHQGLISSILVGLCLGAIVSIGFKDDAVETPSARCQDRVVAISAANTCPAGTFLELENDGDGNTFIVCHCKQPIRVNIQMSPSQLPDPFSDDGIMPAPEVHSPRGPITL